EDRDAGRRHVGLAVVGRAQAARAEVGDLVDAVRVVDADRVAEVVRQGDVERPRLGGRAQRVRVDLADLEHGDVRVTGDAGHERVAVGGQDGADRTSSARVGAPAGRAAAAQR